MANLGNNLRIARERAGLSYRELYKLSGVAYTNICCYEKGTKVPGVETLDKLANTLDVKIDTLLHSDLAETNASV